MKVYARKEPYTKGPYRKRPISERFWEKVPVRSPWPEDCWEFVGSKNKGYGQFGMGYRPIGAHIVAWQLTGGEIPDGMEIDHVCRNTACVRPGHLSLATKEYNAGQGLATRNARKRAQSHCKRGHELSGENLGRQGPDGKWRFCRACAKARMKAYIRKDR